MQQQQIPAGAPLVALEVADCAGQRYLLAGTCGPGKPGSVRVFPQGPVTNSSSNGSSSNGNTAAASAAAAAASAGASGGSSGGSTAGAAGTGSGSTEAVVECTEFVCLSGPVTCMRLNHDCSMLFVGGEVSCPVLRTSTHELSCVYCTIKQHILIRCRAFMCILYYYSTCHESYDCVYIAEHWETFAGYTSRCSMLHA
jgi:hypothetical protein